MGATVGTLRPCFKSDFERINALHIWRERFEDDLNDGTLLCDGLDTLVDGESVLFENYKRLDGTTPNKGPRLDIYACGNKTDGTEQECLSPEELDQYFKDVMIFGYVATEKVDFTKYNERPTKV